MSESNVDNNLYQIGPDSYGNLFAFSVHSPNSIVFDASIGMQIQNNRMKNDLYLRTLNAGLPVANISKGWGSSMIMKSLLTHIAEGNVETKKEDTKIHYDYLPGYSMADASQQMINNFKVTRVCLNVIKISFVYDLI